MSCPQWETLYEYYDKGLSVEQTELLEYHLKGCTQCRAQVEQIAFVGQSIGGEVEAFQDPQLQQQIVAAAKAAPPVHRLPSKIPLAAAAAFALAIALGGLTFWQYSREQIPPDFSARGQMSQELDQWVSLLVFVVDQSAQGYVPAGRQIRPDDALTFAVMNRQPSPGHYLVVVAVDERGTLFWYYPGIDKAGKAGDREETMGLEIKTAESPIELPEEIQQDLAPGWLRFYAIFSEQPLTLHSVEQSILSGLDRGASIVQMNRLPLSKTGQHSVLLRVQKPSQGK